MNKKIDSLTGARFLAIMMIVFSHFDFLTCNENVWWVYKTFFKNASLGVNYFFMLSGFGLYVSYSTHNAKLQGGVKYALKHIKKIYPYYIISMILCVPYYVIKSIILYNKTLTLTLKESVIKLIPSIVMIQSWFGLEQFSRAFNSVGWFLSVLFGLYIVAYYIIPWLDRNIKSLKSCVSYLGILLIMNASISYLLSGIEENTILNDLAYGSPYGRICYVLNGIVLGKLYCSFGNQIGQFYKEQIARYECYIIAIYCSYFVLHNTFLAYAGIITLCVDFFIAGTLVMILCLNKGSISVFFSRKKLVDMGNMSMYIYLFHYPISLYAGLFVDLTKCDSLWAVMIFCFLTVCGSIYIARKCAN